IEGLRGIAAAKMVEREAGRNALRERLAGLSSEFSEELEYFEARTTLWAAESIEQSEAQKVADRVMELQAELRSRRALQEAPHAHYAEARRIREQINGLEDTIYRHLETLGAQFESKPLLDTREAPSPLAAVVVREPAPAAKSNS